ncbi:MAG: endonuclease III [Spirochaetota bacterium]
MNRRKSLRIISLLRAHYGEVKPALLYRDNFQLCIAVVLSAQTTDKQVNEVTPALFRKYPGFKALSEGRISDIENIIHSTGFYRAKAKNISALAKRVVENFNGKLPSERDALESLPGVGRKTANVILSQGFGIPAFAVDTHVGRLARRIGFTQAEDPLNVEKDLISLIPEKDWTQSHLLLITHGRSVCTARKPSCRICPISAECGFPDKTF